VVSVWAIACIVDENSTLGSKLVAMVHFFASGHCDFWYAGQDWGNHEFLTW